MASIRPELQSTNNKMGNPSEDKKGPPMLKLAMSRIVKLRIPKNWSPAILIVTLQIAPERLAVFCDRNTSQGGLSLPGDMVTSHFTRDAEKMRRVTRFPLPIIVSDDGSPLPNTISKNRGDTAEQQDVSMTDHFEDSSDQIRASERDRRPEGRPIEETTEVLSDSNLPEDDRIVTPLSNVFQHATPAPSQDRRPSSLVYQQSPFGPIALANRRMESSEASQSTVQSSAGQTTPLFSSPTASQRQTVKNDSTTSVVFSSPTHRHAGPGSPAEGLTCPTPIQHHLTSTNARQAFNHSSLGGRQIEYSSSARALIGPTVSQNQLADNSPMQTSTNSSLGQNQLTPSDSTQAVVDPNLSHKRFDVNSLIALGGPKMSEHQLAFSNPTQVMHYPGLGRNNSHLGPDMPLGIQFSNAPNRSRHAPLYSSSDHHSLVPSHDDPNIHGNAPFYGSLPTDRRLKAAFTTAGDLPTPNWTLLERLRDSKTDTPSLAHIKYNLAMIPVPRRFLQASGSWRKFLPTELSFKTFATANLGVVDDFESMEEFRKKLTIAIGQMMFVSGETAEPSTETTGMIEEIVRQQVIEMLTQSSLLANRRGVRSISTADLIFLIRHDKAKVSRLRTFLSWKDVRKNVKDSDDKGGGDAGEVDFDEGANLPGAGPTDSKKSTNKKAKLLLPWEVQSFYSEQVPERDDEEDNEEEEEQNEATLARLASADERTKHMTRDEYVFWSDCRQASFTFRKGKRFREWAGFGVVTDSKPNDDIVDILGFLTFEIVQTLTEEALKVKAAQDLETARTSGAAGGEANLKKRKRELSSLFEMPEEGRTPIEPRHVREAFRRLQIIPKKNSFMRQGYAGMRTPLRLI